MFAKEILERKVPNRHFFSLLSLHSPSISKKISQYSKDFKTTYYEYGIYFSLIYQNHSNGKS